MAVTEQQIRWVALFFIFATLDERDAIHAAGRTIAVLKNRLRSLDGEEDDPEARILVLQACFEHFMKIKKHVTRGKLALDFQSGWSLPDHAELAPWARFHKDASDEELIALLFSRVMGFSDSEIAIALGITEGTARYRVGKAVRQLGVANRLTL